MSELPQAATLTDPLAKEPEHIVACAECEGNLFVLGSHGSAWCRKCGGTMDLTVGQFVVPPPMDAPEKLAP